MKKNSFIIVFVFIFEILIFSDNVYIKTITEKNISHTYEVSILSDVNSNIYDIDNIKIRKGSLFIRSKDKNVFSSGSSGAPLYIDGEISGALAYSLQGSNNSVGIVTPIDDITGYFNEYVHSYPLIGALNKNLIIFSNLDNENVIDRIEQKTGMKMISFPFLEKNSSPDKIKDIEINPGDCVIASLVKGDINIGMLGSVTLKEKDDIYAFGHKVFLKGAANYFLFKADIITTVSDDNVSYKLGVPSNLVGVAVQDGDYGIKGKINKFPFIIPFKINYIDKYDNVKHFNTQIVKNNDVFLKIFDSVLYTGLEKHYNGPSLLCDIKLTFEDNEYKQYSVDLENIFFQKKDSILGEISSYIYNIAQDIINNPFKRVSISNVNVTFKEEDENNIFYIQNVEKEISNNTLILNFSGIQNLKGKKEFAISMDVKNINKDDNIEIITPRIKGSLEFSDFDSYLKSFKEVENDIIIKIEVSSEDNIIIKKIKSKFNFANMESHL